MCRKCSVREERAEVCPLPSLIGCVCEKTLWFPPAPSVSVTRPCSPGGLRTVASNVMNLMKDCNTVSKSLSFVEVDGLRE